MHSSSSNSNSNSSLPPEHSPNFNPQTQEKKVFSLHLIYTFLEGGMLGVIALNEFIFSKTLHATPLILGLLFQVGAIVMLFSIFFNEILQRVENKTRFLKWVAICTRLPLLGVFLFPETLSSLGKDPFYQYVLLGIFFIYYMAQPVMFPIINLLLKSNYRPGNLGKLYAYATTLNLSTSLIVGYIFGRILDYYELAFLYLYPLVGICGIFSIYLLTRIPPPLDSSFSSPEKGFWKSVYASFSQSAKILKQHRSYRHFELGFMGYGIGFMLSFAVMVIFFTQVLKLDYSQIAIYKGIQVLVAILTLPLFGKIMDKMDPRKFAILVYLFLFFCYVFYLATYQFPAFYSLGSFPLYYFLVLAQICFGLFLSSIIILWNIGSSYFCHSQQAATYQSLHLSLTGSRGLFAPILGVAIYEITGIQETFVCSMILLLIAIAIMIYSLHTVSLEKLPPPEENPKTLQSSLAIEGSQS